MKAAFFKIGFFLVLLSGIAALNPFLFPGYSEHTSSSRSFFELFIGETDRFENLDEIVREGGRSLTRIPGNSFNVSQPHQKFLLKIKFDPSWGDDDLLLQIRPIAASLGARVFSKDFVLYESLTNSSGVVQLNTPLSELKLRQVGRAKSPEVYIEISNRFSEVITINAEKLRHTNGDGLFGSGLYLGVAIFCCLLPIFFYFQYKQKIFLLLDAFILSLIVKFLFANALISEDYLEIHGVISHLYNLNIFFYLINLLQSLFLIFFIKLVIKNKYVYIASLINLLIYLIFILSTNSILNSILLNIFYIFSYLLILSIFIIYIKDLKINGFMYFMAYGIQFFALYLLAIKYYLIQSPIDYIFYYFNILPLTYFIFFMYMLAHHYNLILINKIYVQNQSTIKANYQLELIKNVSNSQVLLLEAISHEIKSPLMALYFLIDKISPSEEGLAGITQRIKSVLNQIGYIIERFSSLTKFYSINDLNIKKNIDISILITSILEVRPEHKGINLNCDGDTRVDSDYVLLQIIFQNLIENAIKYRVDSESPININVAHFKENILRVDISNSLHKNIRIDLDKIFDMYYRGPNIKNEPGMGVGLWITREIAKKINAEINVIMECDKVTFTVYIPISLSI